MNTAQNIVYKPVLTEDEQAFLDELNSKWTNKDNYIFVNSKKKTKQYKIKDAKAFLKLNEGFWEKDLMFTPNTFKNAKKGHESTRRTENLFHIYSIALDVDYRGSKGFNTSLKPLEVLEGVIEHFTGSKIPEPSYVEYGHQLRLIYVLKEPIIVHNNKKLIDTAKIVLKRLSDALNEEYDLNCEPQKLNSYYRMPNSINSKDGSRVHVKAYSNERYTLQEIMDEYLPYLPIWYDSWKEKTIVGKTEKGIHKIYNQYQLWKDRQKLFLELRDYEGIPREKLVHFYAQSLVWTNENDVLCEILKFNKGFPEPLPEKEVRSKFNRINKYKYKNETIMAELGIEDETLMTKREILKREKIANGTTRKQLAEKNYQTAKQYYLDGMNYHDIAKKMEMSDDSIRKYITRIRKEIAQ